MPDTRTNSRGAALAAQLRTQIHALPVATTLVRLPIPEIAEGFIFEFEARRVDINSLLMGGAIPESLARTILEIRTPEAAERVAEEARAEAERMPVEEQLQLIEFQKRIAIEVCHEPKLVYRPVCAANEIDLREVPFADKLIRALYGYAMGLSPAVPVARTDGGETTVDAVEEFLKDTEFLDDRAHGAPVRKIAQ
ncbi:MAG: hypothetical protein E6Q97_19970 [Desulfurellales bacterium]|nr:MAG: hypothetical protein E6Q97_19970 [Desulfurellales bacterium]